MPIIPRGALAVPPDANIIDGTDVRYPAPVGWHYTPIVDSLFRRALIGDYHVSVSDIEQGGIGDCFLLAALLSIVDTAQGPGYINRIIRDNGDGTSFVRLFTPTNQVQYFRVSNTKLDNGRTFHRANWVYVMEKAMAVHRMLYGGKCYAPTEEKIEDHNGKLYYRRVHHPARAPANLTEALDGGHSSYCFNALFNTPTIASQSRISAFEGDIISEQNTFVYSLYHIMTGIFPGQTVDMLENNDINALEKVFGPIAEPANKVMVDDFLSKLKVLMDNNFYRIAFTGQVPRYHAVQLFLGYNFPVGVLRQDTKQRLLEYTERHISHKRGTGKYIFRQNRLFNRIQSSLQANHLICMGSHGNLGRVDSGKNPLATNETTVKGLVGPHAYQVIDAYQRGNLKFLLLRNPWGLYGRTYQRVSKQFSVRFRNPNDISEDPMEYHLEQTVLSARATGQATVERYSYDDVALPHGENINGAHRLGEHRKLLNEQGVFELEITDATKRCDTLYIINPDWTG